MVAYTHLALFPKVVGTSLPQGINLINNNKVYFLKCSIGSDLSEKQKAITY